MECLTVKILFVRSVHPKEEADSQLTFTSPNEYKIHYLNTIET